MKKEQLLRLIDKYISDNTYYLITLPTLQHDLKQMHLNCCDYNFIFKILKNHYEL